MTSGEAQLLESIRTRGHCEFIVRPTAFIQHRLERNELYDLVAASSVVMRGWDVPPIDRNSRPHIDVEWVGQQIDWEHHLQVWRFYRSGQFVMISGIPYEWRDRSGWWPPKEGWAANTIMGVLETVASLTEYLEFAARLSKTKAGDDSMTVSVVLKPTDGRLLVMESFNRDLHGQHRASVPEISVTQTLSRVDLATRAQPLAVEFAVEVFSLFGWNVKAEIVKDIQGEFMSKR